MNKRDLPAELAEMEKVGLQLQAENARLREAALAALECIERNVPANVFAPRQWLREVLGLPLNLGADLEGRN